MAKILFLTFPLSALLLLSGCEYLSGFKEIDISQTGISKVCDKKHKLKYPEIVPSYITGISYIKGNENENILKKEYLFKKRVYLLARNKCKGYLANCIYNEKFKYEVEPIVLLVEINEKVPLGFIAFPNVVGVDPKEGLSAIYGKLIGTFDMSATIYNVEGINVDLKSAQLWIIRGYKSTKNEPCKR